MHGVTPPNEHVPHRELSSQLAIRLAEDRAEKRRRGVQEGRGVSSGQCVWRMPRAGRRRRPMQQQTGWVALHFCLMVWVVSCADGGNLLSLNMEGPATMCRAGTSWVRRDCQMLASDSIPALSVGLFNRAGVQCCGQDQVAVRLKVTKGAVEYTLTGFADKDSTPGAPGSRMTVEFTNLKLADRKAAGEFNATVTSFYLGFPLEYTVPLRILPSKIELLPWGSLTAEVQALPDRGPWTVHESLPPFRLALQAHNITVPFTANEKFLVGVRLFRPVDMLDITVASLEGTTIRQANQGIAVFNHLRIKKAAGTGYRLSFFVVGADKECLPNTLRQLCEEWKSSRNYGGMGGYHVEILGPEVTIVPDRVVLTPYGDNQPPWKIGEALKAYRITVYDSVDMNSVRSEVTTVDDLRISVALFSNSGLDLTTTSLIGTKTQTIDSGIAEFEDLMVSGVVGLDFTLEFSVSWRDRCVRKLRDERCAGECCLKVTNINIYPQQMLVGHPLTVPLVTEGDVIANFSVLFTDFDRNVLTQVGAGLGLHATAFLSQRGVFFPDNLQGRMVLDVTGGISQFTDLSIVEHAGRAISVVFSDTTSQISTVSAIFDVFPKTILFDGSLDNAVTGGPIQVSDPAGKITIKLLSSQGNILSSSLALDNFVIEIFAASRVAGVWVDCGCLLGPNTSLAVNGIATFDAHNLSIPSAVGTFLLQFKLQREGLAALTSETNAFDLKPQGIYIKTSALLTEVLVGDMLGLVQIGFNDDFGDPITNVGDLSSGVFEALLLEGSTVLATRHLSGTMTTAVSKGGAAFGDLRVQTYAGKSLRLNFVFTNTVGNEKTIFQVASSTFTVRPASLSINNTRPNSVTDLHVPALNVSVQDVNGAPLPMVARDEGFVVSIELYTLRYLGCASYSDFNKTFASVSWEECAQLAVAAKQQHFVTGRDTPPDSHGFCGLLKTPQNASANNAYGLPALGCAVGCENDPAGCDAASSNRSFFSITNSTASMVGNKTKVVNGGCVIFSGLRVTGLYGIKSSILAVRNRGTVTEDVAAYTHALTIDPVNWKVTGLPNAPHLLSQPLAPTNISAIDLNGNTIESIFAFEAYVVEVALLHAGIEVNHRLGLPHSRKMPHNRLSFILAFFETGGSNFSVTVSMKMQSDNPSNSLVANSSHFIIYPDQLILVGAQGSTFDAYSDTVLSQLVIRCENLNGTLITDIQPRDGLTIAVNAIDLNGATIPTCSPGSASAACLGGTVEVIVGVGISVFDNLLFVGSAGAGTRLNFQVLGGGPIAVWSSKFSVFPSKVFISEGEYKFNGVQWIIDKGLGDYALSLRGAADEVIKVATNDGFVITVSLRQSDSVDRTAILAGGKSYTCNHTSARSASAIFTDLVVTKATGNLKIYFTLSHPNSSLTIENSTKEFSAAPYALRISQNCFNGQPLDDSVSSVPNGVPLLECVGPGAEHLGRDFGRFGYLTGYYRYENNENIGPLLLNVRGIARVPPIDVLAIDLNLDVQTLIQSTHKFKINLKLFVGESQYTGNVIGNTVQVMNDGMAQFHDLQISSIPECSPNCTLLLRFNLDGVLCSDTWCTNVTMDLKDVPIVAPHLLGSHPAFPGSSHIEGTIRVPCLTKGQFTSLENQNVFRHAILAATAVPFLKLENILILEPTSTPPADADLHVKFRIRTQSYAASTAVMSTVTDQFREGTQIFKYVCTRLGKNSTFVEICADCINTPKLVGTLTRTIRSALIDGRVKHPQFDPPGLPEGICLRGDWAAAGTCIVPFGAFVEFDLLLTVDDLNPTTIKIYYTLDTCPIGTEFCTTTGSIPSSSEAPISNYARNGQGSLKVFGTIPTTSLMPDGFAVNEFMGFFSGDKIAYEIDETLQRNLHWQLIQNEKYIGIRGNRHTSTQPRFLTAKAFASRPSQTNSFPVSTTFELSPQASSPQTDLHSAELWVLGWCNETHSSFPNARVGDPFMREGSCADIQHTNDSSVCSGAGAVPCRLKSVEKAYCTAGSLSYTIADKGLYDGVLLRASGTTTLSQPFIIGNGRIYVTSVAALGFTNDGALEHTRNIWTMCQGQAGCTEGMFTVFKVRASENSLEVSYDHEFSYATGIVLSLNDTCTAGLVHETMIIPLWTSTAGATIYYNIPGTDPTSSSHKLAPSNSLAIRVETETSFRAVAAGDKLMNSRHLHLDVTARPCGNGVINGGEQCDDGNLVDGDLCSSECMFERECTDTVWQEVSHHNIGIHYMDFGSVNNKPDALIISQSTPNGTGLTSDCKDWLVVSHIRQIETGGARHLIRPTSKGRMADGGCSVGIGSEILFAGNYLHAVNEDLQGNPVTGQADIPMYDVEGEVFSADKYSFSYPKTAMACQAIGTQAWFGGGIRADPQNDGGNDDGYIMVDDIDQVDVVLPTEEMPESTPTWTYGKYKLSVSRTYLASAHANGLVAFAGGIDLNTGEVFANFDVLDPAAGSVDSNVPLPTARYLHIAVAVGPLILCAGGANLGGYLKSIDIYDTRYRNFTSLPNGLSSARVLLAGASTDTKGFFAGGYDGVASDVVDMFDLATGLMTVVDSLREARFYLIGAYTQGLILFGGGRRATGRSPSGSDLVDVYDGYCLHPPACNHSVVTMSEPRYFHFGGSVKQYAVFGLGAPNDPGFANPKSWLTAPLSESVDIFDMSPVQKKVRANVTSPSSTIPSRTVTLPYYHRATRINLALPLNTESNYDDQDKWRLTCEPGFRFSRYEPVPQTSVYSSFLCACTNVTNFFNKPSLFPSDQAVMLRVPLPPGMNDCRDVCLPPRSSQPRTFVGLTVKYSGTHLVDDLQITPLTANTFCLGTNEATVNNVTRNSAGTAATAVVTDSSGTSQVNLPYNIAELDVRIDMPLSDALRHAEFDTWTVTCGGNTTGYVIMSFDVTPSVCSLVLSPFD